MSADANFLRKYVLCIYFINTVFTTVGFGDISATNTAEQARLPGNPASRSFDC